MDEINTFNKFMIGVRGDNIVLMHPVPQLLNKEDALLLAALITLALSGDHERFKRVLEAVENI